MTQEQMCNAVASSRDDMVRISKAITRNRGSAEEIVQAVSLSALLQIARNQVRASNEQKFKAWLFTILRRNAMRRAGESNNDVVPTAGERNVRRLFKEYGSLRRFEVQNVCDSSGANRNIARSSRKHTLSEIERD